MPTAMRYSVTADGTIVRAESCILRESAENDAEFALPFNTVDIVGRNLFDFIEGMEVRHLYSLFHRRVLDGGASIAFEYRCDSDWVRRNMRMSLSPDGPLINYESVVLKEVVRPIPLPRSSASATEFVPICSICMRYRYPAESAGWRDVDSILSEPALPRSFHFTHTVCPDCFDHCLSEA